MTFRQRTHRPQAPGDALTVPDGRVDTLPLPVHAPWSTVGDLIDYVREVAPRDSPGGPGSSGTFSVEVGGRYEFGPSAAAAPE